jgi:nitroreductase
MINEKTVSDAIEYRRSVRVFSDQDLDSEIVKKCLYNASLAPNSSNLQLWEFIHVNDDKILKKLSKACFNQNAAKTAKQLVVIVVRKDLWKKRANWNIEVISNQSKNNQISDKRLKQAKAYYKKVIPTLYTDFFGILGMLKSLIFQTIGLDTCPMEGSDTLKVKNILNLPSGSEINMVIGCGIRTNEGIYGDQLRVPFNEVYTYI